MAIEWHLTALVLNGPRLRCAPLAAAASVLGPDYCQSYSRHFHISTEIYHPYSLYLIFLLQTETATGKDAKGSTKHYYSGQGSGLSESYRISVAPQYVLRPA
jgi:hypothetical protein